MSEGKKQRATLVGALGLLSLSGLALIVVGCTRNGESSGNGKLKIAYVGLTCEAPLFVAVEKGFCKEEGLDVELIATDWDGLREGLGLGRFDASQTLLMYLIKPIAEQALDVKITGGIHTGCLRVQVGVKSTLSKITELKGKRIGVPTHLGSPPHLFAARVLSAHGIDPSMEKKEVTWVTYGNDVIGKALEDGSVDAIATSDPIGTILLGLGQVKTIADQATDAPYCDEYCCVSFVSGKLARNNPTAAAKITRALLKAAKWTEANSTAAARLAVEKKYTVASIELNTQAISKLKFTPGVSTCKGSIDQAVRDMKKAGLLKDHVDPTGAVARAWLDLDGVNDDWLKTVAVERVAGGGRPNPMPPEIFAQLCRERPYRLGCCPE